jgi:hypothetical protein
MLKKDNEMHVDLVLLVALFSDEGQKFLLDWTGENAV